jgi:hypothetical protein
VLRRRRVRLWVALGVLVVLLSGLTVLRVLFHGRNLALFVSDRVMNPHIRGQVEAETIEWSWTGLFHPSTLPIEIRGVKVWDSKDPKTRKLVMDVPRVTGKVDLWPLVWPYWPYGHHDLIVRDLALERGFCLVEERLVAEGPKDTEFGFLAAFGSSAPKARVPGEERPGAIYWLKNISLSHVRLELRFLSWVAIFDDMSTDGWMRQSGRIPGAHDFTYSLAPRSPRTQLQLFGQDLDLRDVAATQFGQLPTAPDALSFQLAARTADAADLRIAGQLTKLYDLDPLAHGVVMTLDATSAGALARRVSQGLIEGNSLGAHLTFEGPLAGPRIRLQASGIGVPVVSPDTEVTELDLSYDLLRDQGELDDLEVDLLGGHATAKGTVTVHSDPVTQKFQGLTFDARAAVPSDQPVDLAAYLPPEVLRAVGKPRGSGHLRAHGSLDEITLDDLDLALGNAKIRGGAQYRRGVATVKNLSVVLPGARATASGQIDLGARSLRLGFQVSVQKMGQWLRAGSGTASLTRSTAASAIGTVSGTLDAPVVDAQIEGRGVPWADRLMAKVRYVHQRAQVAISRLVAHPLGGEVKGGGTLTLGKKQSLSAVSLSGQDLDLSRLPGTRGLLSGTVGFELSADGPLRRPLAQLTLAATDVDIAGDTMPSVRSQMSLDPKGLTLQSFHAIRSAGGSLDVVGQMGYDRSLNLDVDLRHLSLATLVAMHVDPTLRLRGDVSLGLHVGGTVDRPAPEGVVALSGIALFDTLLGVAQISFQPKPDGRVAFKGKLFQGKFGVEGSFLLRPPYPIDVRVSLRRVELDEFLPGPLASAGAHGWVTGELEAHLSSGQPEKATLRLSQLVLFLDGTDAEGRPSPLTLSNRDPIEVAFDGASAHLAAPVRLGWDTGEFVLAGSVSPRALDVTVRGKVQLVLAEFFFPNWLEGARGTATVDLHVSGKPEAPRVEGVANLNGAAFRRHGSEAEVQVPSGTIHVSNTRLDVSDLILAVDGQKLSLGGHLDLSGLVPSRIQATLQGRLPARLLEILASQYFSGASGSAPLSLTISGDVMNPEVNGTLAFDSPFQITPRLSTYHELVLSSGKLAFSNQQIAPRALAGTLDDGRIGICTQPDGTFCGVRLHEWKPVDIALQISTQGFTFRKASEFDVEINANLRLVGDMQGLKLRGGLEIVDGRYLQYLDYGDKLSRHPTTERAEEFGAGIFLLETLQLNLDVTTLGDFQVNGNIIDMTLRGALVVTGTPKNIRFAGTISVVDGSLRLPIFRPSFTLKPGTLMFSPLKEMPSDTPEIFLVGETLFQDALGQEYLVTAELKGTLGRSLDLDLRTDTGLNKAQTLALITVGSTTDQLRESANLREGPPPESSDPTRGSGSASIGGSSSRVGNQADYLIKTALGSSFQLVSGPLKEWFNGMGIPLSCANLLPGTVSWQVQLCAKIGRSVSFVGDWDVGLRGGYNLKVGADWKIVDNFLFFNNVSLAGGMEHRVPEQESEEIENTGRGQFKLRFVIP